MPAILRGVFFRIAFKHLPIFARCKMPCDPVPVERMIRAALNGILHREIGHGIRSVDGHAICFKLFCENGQGDGRHRAPNQFCVVRAKFGWASHASRGYSLIKWFSSGESGSVRNAVCVVECIWGQMRIYQINSDMRFLQRSFSRVLFRLRQLFQNIINHALPQLWGLCTWNGVLACDDECGHRIDTHAAGGLILLAHFGQISVRE